MTGRGGGFSPPSETKSKLLPILSRTLCNLVPCQLSDLVPHPHGLHFCLTGLHVFVDNGKPFHMSPMVHLLFTLLGQPLHQHFPVLAWLTPSQHNINFPTEHLPFMSYFHSHVLRKLFSDSITNVSLHSQAQCHNVTLSLQHLSRSEIFFPIITWLSSLPSKANECSTKVEILLVYF